MVVQTDFNDILDREGALNCVALVVVKQRYYIRVQDLLLLWTLDLVLSQRSKAVRYQHLGAANDTAPTGVCGELSDLVLLYEERYEVPSVSKPKHLAKLLLEVFLVEVVGAKHGCILLGVDLHFGYEPGLDPKLGVDEHVDQPVLVVVVYVLIHALSVLIIVIKVYHFEVVGWLYDGVVFLKVGAQNRAAHGLALVDL